MKISANNLVKQRLKAGLPSIGIQVKESSQHLVEIVGAVGADFVKLDSLRWAVGPEMFQGLIQTAWSHQLMPWIASPNEFFEIMWRMDMGAQGLSIACVKTADDVKRMIDAVYYPPVGKRESNRPLRFRAWSADQYFAWARNELLLCAQIEDLDGLRNLKEICKVPELDVICVGSGDLSFALGVTNRNDPRVLETRKRIHLEALQYGKAVTVTVPVTSEGLDEAAFWVEQGCKLITFDGPFKVLTHIYGNALKTLKKSITYPESPILPAAAE